MHLGYYYQIQRFQDFATVTQWEDCYGGRFDNEVEAKEEFKNRWINHRNEDYRLLKCFDSEHGRHIKEIIQEIKAKK